MAGDSGKAGNEPNWDNQTIWTGDNLEIMRGMNSASVDLIYLDPPFNSNKDYLTHSLSAYSVTGRDFLVES